MSRPRSFKRPHHHGHEDEEEVTDDLEIAAAYAVAQYSPPPPPPCAVAAVIVDENEIDVEEEDEEEESNLGNIVEMETGYGANGAKKEASESILNHKSQQDNNDESDAESDIDLTDALEKMDKHAELDDEGDDGDDKIDERNDSDTESDPNVQAKVSQATTDNAKDPGEGPPQTTHEVDGYRGSVQQVEEIIGTSLQVDEALYATPQHTHPAGHIQHFMAEERIMVIRSLGNCPLLLEEGNLLVLREPSWIPLGKILEVFGPVSQPMYSIRLPEPLESIDGATKIQNCTKMHNDPWSPAGKYTQWIRQHPYVMVHYLPQQAKLVDTHMLLAQRQRGCDASNMYDEEIQRGPEMDYSDDEQERAARSSSKGRRKGGGRRGQNQHQRVNTAANGATVPTPGGFFTRSATSGMTAYSTTPPVATFAQPHPLQPEESDTIYYD